MQKSKFRYFILHKPTGMESQFVSPYESDLLGDIDFDFPEGTHAIGRLDKNSEGLLLLTTNKKITALLFQSKLPHKRIYLVQVKFKMNEESLKKLQEGVSIRIKGGGFYTTPPCQVEIIENPENIFLMPQNFHPYMDTTWILITLTEGKFRQVRKMVTAVRHRCLRLIRIAIENIQLEDLKPGEVKEIEEDDFFELLNLGDEK